MNKPLIPAENRAHPLAHQAKWYNAGIASRLS